MVLLGGLEIVAAGYLINKHQKNKKERARIEDERLRLEEEQYHLFPPQGQRRHHRSHSEGRDTRERRDSRDRRDSYDRKDSRDSRRHSRERKSRRDTTRPASTSPVPPYKAHSVSPRPHVQSNQRPAQQPYVQPIPERIPRPYQAQPIPQTVVHPAPRPQAQPQTHSYPPDIKYGWSDNQPSSSSSQLDGFPPTGWPAHWEQSNRPEPNSRQNPRSPYQNPNMSRSSEIRPNESRVRFAVPENSSQPGDRDSSVSPPPYRP